MHVIRSPFRGAGRHVEDNRGTSCSNPNLTFPDIPPRSPDDDTRAGTKKAPVTGGFEWCAWQESNLRPCAPEAHALSPELQARGGLVYPA